MISIAPGFIILVLVHNDDIDDDGDINNDDINEADDVCFKPETHENQRICGLEGQR